MSEYYWSRNIIYASISANVAVRPVILLKSTNARSFKPLLLFLFQQLDPLDGGTDNGFTFTAANWPTQPQGIAYRITSRYPAHPAGSFYYPNLPRLPPIATLTFTKVHISYPRTRAILYFLHINLSFEIN